MKRNELRMKQARALLIAVDALLTSAENPDSVTTKTIMCGRRELEELRRHYKVCWAHIHGSPSAASDTSSTRQKP